MNRNGTDAESGEALTGGQAVLDMVIAIALVPASAIGAGLLIGLFSDGPPSLAPVVFLQALLTLGGVAAILARREHSWPAIGLRPPRAADLPRAGLLLLVTFAANAVLMALIVALSPETFDEHLAGLRSLAAELTEETPLAAVLALLLVVGFYEEVLARGLLLTRSRQLFGGYWLPVVFSTVLFALGHFYQGPFGVVQTGLIGFVLAAFTVRWGTLWPAIFAHSAINMLSVVQLGS